MIGTLAPLLPIAAHGSTGGNALLSGIPAVIFLAVCVFVAVVATAISFGGGVKASQGAPSGPRPKPPPAPPAPSMREVTR
jgi:hypothetical protein